MNDTEQGFDSAMLPRGNRGIAATVPVSLVVRGKFHYLGYFGLLAKEGIDAHLYYSHRRGTTRTFGIDERLVTNLPLTEYLVQLEGRLPLPENVREGLRTMFGRIWSMQVLAQWHPVKVLHLLCHGHGVPILRRARAEGARVIAEVVNSHPEHLNAIISAERQRLGLPDRIYVHHSAADRMRVEVEGADIILAPSRHVQRTYTERGTPADRIAILPYAANLDRFGPRMAPRRPGPLRLICVGAISVRKGQLILLEALRRLGTAQVELSLIGHIENDVKPLLKPYEGLFRHYPHVPNSELVDLLHDHDVFVLPTLEEGMAIANREAMASGLCVLTTYASGAEEVIDLGKTGLLVPAGSWEVLADAIAMLATSRDIIDEMGRRAAEEARSHSNWTTYAADLASLYRRLLEA